MMGPKLFSLILIIVAYTSSFSQSDSVKLHWIELSFFHQKVFNKIFFSYDSNNVYPGVSPKGMVIFILPDSVFRTIVPDVFDRLDYSWPKEQMPLTTRLIENERGTVFCSSYLLNSEIVSWLRFDDFSMSSSKRVNIRFHTTDYAGKIPVKDLKFYSVSCIMKKVKQNGMSSVFVSVELHAAIVGEISLRQFYIKNAQQGQNEFQGCPGVYEWGGLDGFPRLGWCCALASAMDPPTNLLAMKLVLPMSTAV